MNRVTERVEFRDLTVGSILWVTAGQAEDAWQYCFKVEDVSDKWPDGQLTVINPDEEEVGTFPFSLHGCGRWTDRKQNPVQDQERAFTPYFDGLIVGSFLWGKHPDHQERLVFDKPGQEISHIALIRD